MSIQILHLGKEVQEEDLEPVFRKYASEHYPIEMFQALLRNAKHDEPFVAKTASWTLEWMTNDTVKVLSEKVAA